MEPTVLIVGYGIVGHNLAEEIKILHPDIYDKFKPEHNTKKDIMYDFAFICVNTPLGADGLCDISAVEAAIEETQAQIIVIKSTIPPGTTQELNKRFHKQIIFSPEYYGNTPHSKNFVFNFTVLGGDKRSCIITQQLLQKVYDATHIFRIVKSTTAELLKYMENCYLAMKVSFCTQFYELSQYFGVDYEDLRELFILDPRVNPSHTYVYRWQPFYDSDCLNKDTKAIANMTNATFLKGMIAWNEWMKNKYQNKKD